MYANPKDIVLLTNLTLREFNNVKNLSYYQESRVIVSPKIESKQLNELIKFRNEYSVNPYNSEINDISKQNSNPAKQGQTVLHSLQAINEDAKKKILYGSEEKVFYNTFAYFDSLSVNKNITWQKSEQDEFIYLATAKITDNTSSMWVTVCGGGDVIFDVSPKEAHHLQTQDRKNANDEGGVSANSLLKNLVHKRKGCGFWIKLRAQKNSYQGAESVKFTTIAAYTSPSENDPRGQKMNRALLNTLKMLKKSNGIE